MRAAFYCMSSAAYFLGAVGLMNSLRIQGHDEPIFVLDLGLEPWQRDLLATEATIVRAPAGTEPWLAKTVAPLAHPAETMVLIDADIVVTRPLTELLSRAAEGRIVAIENDTDRFDMRWGDALGLGELERRQYVSSGLVALGGDTGHEVLRLLDERQRAADVDRSHFGEDEAGYELRFLDQDVLNAILCSDRVAADRVVALDARNAAVTPFGGLEVRDPVGLRCEFPDGFEPLVVHYILSAKPWQHALYHGPYSLLLQRTLVGPGLAIEVPPDRIPLRLRDGVAARLERGRIHARDRLGWRARALMPDDVMSRLDRWRRRRAVVRR